MKSLSLLSCTFTLLLTSCGLSAQTPASSTAVSSVPSWFDHCAGENGQCTVLGPAQVIFGTANGNSPAAGGHFLTQTVTGNVSCSDAVFGDADPGNPKGCWYGPVAGLPQGKILATGGSDYPFFVQNFETWDNNQRTVVGQYQLDPGLVAAQLQQMYKEGQRNVALVIWYLPYTPSQIPVNGVLYGAFLDSTAGQLSPQVQQNLTAVLNLIKQVGFSQVTLRLAPVGAASPATWGNTWQEATFQQDEAFEFSTRQIAETALAGSSVSRVYDLGVEMGGIPHNPNSDGITYSDGQSIEWTSRLWADYVKQYGANDSFGFSIAYSFGTLTSAIAEYDRAGTRPNSYAIDLYTPSDLWNYYEELVGAKDTAKPVVLQEASYNDASEMQGVANEIQHFPLKIAYIDQWPVSSSVANDDASPPTDYGAYGGNTNTTGTLVVPPCYLASGQTTCSTTANWSTSNATNVGLYVNGVLAQNQPNITSTLTGTANVTLGLTPSTFVLTSSQGTLSVQGSSLTSTAGTSSSSSGATVLGSTSVAAIDPNAPSITLAGLGGTNNRAIWAIGSNISTGCSVQLYDPNATAMAPLASLSSANCNANSLSFLIPTAILSNYNAVNLVVTNPGMHSSTPLYLPIQSIPTLSRAGLGGTANQAIWALGTNISSTCSVQLYDPRSTSSAPLVSVNNVSCQPNSLSFVIPSAIQNNYPAVNLTVTDADGQASSPLLVQIGGGA